MRVLWQFGDEYCGDLAERIRSLVQAGAMLLWIGGSGTCTVFRVEDGLLLRTRLSSGNVHAGDGMALIVQQPFTATSCGWGDGSGYRSTAPVLVAAVETAEDVASAWKDAGAVLTSMTQDHWDAITPGHPADQCSALYCRVRLAAGVRP